MTLFASLVMLYIVILDMFFLLSSGCLDKWTDEQTDMWLTGASVGPLMGFICFIGYNELYMMTPHPCQIPPRSKKTHIHHHPIAHTYTHVHTRAQLQSMVINLIFDKPDICAHEGFGHSVSLDHSLCNTHSHTYRYFLSLSLSLSLLPSPDTVVKDLFDLWPRPTWHRYWFFLRPSQSGMKKGENGGISRHSQV